MLVYQIRNGIAGPGGIAGATGGWRTHHRTDDPITTNRFACDVRRPLYLNNLSSDQIDNFIRENHPAVDPDRESMFDRWRCRAWVANVLYSLSESLYLDLGSHMNHIYPGAGGHTLLRRILLLGMRAQITEQRIIDPF
jgi:hypothetical protein